MNQATDIYEDTQEPTTPIHTPRHYQCRHILTDGHRCLSPCLRGEPFCYYHHTTRRPVANPKSRRSRQSTFDLPLPEDRSAVQHSIGQVLQRIASNQIDPRRAGLLLYGLQIASLNLPKEPKSHANSPSQSPSQTTPPTVAEITHHPTHGPLAPPSEITDSRPPSFLRLLRENIEANLRINHLQQQLEALQSSLPTPPTTPKITPEPTPETLELEPEPQILPTLQATEENTENHTAQQTVILSADSQSYREAQSKDPERASLTQTAPPFQRQPFVAVARPKSVPSAHIRGCYSPGLALKVNTDYEFLSGENLTALSGH